MNSEIVPVSNQLFLYYANYHCFITFGTWIILHLENFYVVCNDRWFEPRVKSATFAQATSGIWIFHFRYSIYRNTSDKCVFGSAVILYILMTCTTLDIVHYMKIILVLYELGICLIFTYNFHINHFTYTHTCGFTRARALYWFCDSQNVINWLFSQNNRIFACDLH